MKVTVICPQNDPSSGWVIYDDAARGAAENRLKTTIAQLREIGIEADGEIMDPDPYAATMDAIHAFGAERGDHLDAPGDALGLDAQGPRHARSKRTAGCRSSTSSSTSTPSART